MRIKILVQAIALSSFAIADPYSAAASKGAKLCAKTVPLRILALLVHCIWRGRPTVLRDSDPAYGRICELLL